MHVFLLVLRKRPGQAKTSNFNTNLSRKLKLYPKILIWLNIFDHPYILRYKHMAETYWDRRKNGPGKQTDQKQASNIKETADPNQLSFKIDIDMCRRIFNEYDQDQSGYLEISELTALAEELWATFHPNSPKLTREAKEVSSSSCHALVKFVDDQ
jgi:hypothetical protein